MVVINYTTSLKRLKLLTHKCKKCGSERIRFDNNRGWTGCDICCCNCKQTVHGNTLKEAVEAWNKIN